MKSNKKKNYNYKIFFWKSAEQIAYVQSLKKELDEKQYNNKKSQVKVSK